MAHTHHYQDARNNITQPIHCGIITISDTRTNDTDTSGATIRKLLEQHGHIVIQYDIVHDAAEKIAALVQNYASAGCHVIITNGGTGITARDCTFEALHWLLEKHIPGFGELFRMLSYQDIGSAALLSRAIAGTYRRSLVFCLPGSTGAVTLALEQLILPELLHMVWEMQRHLDPPPAVQQTETTTTSTTYTPNTPRGYEPDAPVQLTHLDEQGRAQMVDVGMKDVTRRQAIARGEIVMQQATLQHIVDGNVAKGDVFAVARIAGIMAAKQTAQLIPLCHTIPLSYVGIDMCPDETSNRVKIEATVRTNGTTGVEMEALTAVSVAALTIYDMCKAVDRTMHITNVRLVQKRGGQSGLFEAAEFEAAEFEAAE